MTLTRSFDDTVKGRLQSDPAFRIALLTEATQAFLEGDVTMGKALLRDCIDASLGLDELANAIDVEPNGLAQMFSPEGRPNVDEFFSVIGHLQRRSGIQLQVYAS